MTTYYVDVAVGDDGNAGTSEGSGNAWASLAKAADTVAAGDKVFVKASGSYVAQDGANNCIMQLTTAGSTTSWIVFEGYTSTPGDGGKVTLDASTNTLNNCVYTALGALYYMFINFIFTGSNTSGFSGSAADDITIINCTFHDCGDRGIFVDNSLTAINCDFYNNDSEGIEADLDCNIINCKFYNNGQQGTDIGANSCFYNCLFYNNTIAHIYGSWDGCAILNCSFDGDNSILGLDSNTNPATISIINNIFYDCTTAIDLLSSSSCFYDYNLFYSNTTDIDTTGVQIIDGGHNITGTEDPYNDSTNRDYTLKTSSEAQDAGMDLNVF